MKYIILIGLFCLAESALAVHSSLREWADYKRQHGKRYAPEEDAKRFARFLAAKNLVARQDADEPVSHRVGLNHLSDLTEEEFSAMNGFRYDAASHAEGLRQAADSPFLSAILNDPSPAPPEVDWRSVPGRVSDVKNQGQCGSCWAFATTGVLEGQQLARNLTKSLTQLSEQDLVDCSSQNYGCDGGIMASALADIAEMGGIESERQYPYVSPRHSYCKFSKSKVVMTNKGSLDLPHGEETLKRVVAKFGPVAVAIAADRELQMYESGVYDSELCGDELNHAVLVVGYGTDPVHGDFWLVKNSWSAKWGEQGYFRMRRGKRLCGIGTLMTIPEF